MLTDSPEGHVGHGIVKLFVKLINLPYGIPNGIIPLLIALVVHAEGSRIAFYSGAQNQRVGDPQLAKKK